MRRSAFTILFLAFLQAGAAFGSVVVVRAWPNNLVGVTKERTIEWFLNDYACFRPVVEPDRRRTHRERIACGQVVRVTKLGIIVNITGSSVPIKVGYRLEIEKVDDWTY